MAEFSSEIKTVPYPDTDVFDVLSDLRNLEHLKGRIPEDKLKDFSCDQDSCSVSVDPVGKVRFNIIERLPNFTIKFEAAQVPFGLNLFIELEQASADETKIKLVVKADLNPFIKPMVAKPLQQAVDQIAEMMVSIPFGEIKDKNQ